MTRLSILLAATAVSALLPSAAAAVCGTIGTIPRISLTTTVATITVRANTPGTITYVFTTTHGGFLTAAVAAQASHETVYVTGNASSCGAVAGGASAGGAMTGLIVAP
jgi:hypothetical protein